MLNCLSRQKQQMTDLKFIRNNLMNTVGIVQSGKFFGLFDEDTDND